MNANWNPALAKNGNPSSETVPGLFAGLRVRMGCHCGKPGSERADLACLVRRAESESPFHRLTDFPTYLLTCALKTKAWRKRVNFPRRI